MPSLSIAINAYLDGFRELQYIGYSTFYQNNIRPPDTTDLGILCLVWMALIIAEVSYVPGLKIYLSVLGPGMFNVS